MRRIRSAARFVLHPIAREARRWWQGVTWIPDKDDQVGRTNAVASLRKTVFVLCAAVLAMLVGGLYVVSVFQTRYDSTVNQAQASCQRSKTFGPEIERFYATHNVLDARALAVYKATIPARCP